MLVDAYDAVCLQVQDAIGSIGHAESCVAAIALMKVSKQQMGFSRADSRSTGIDESALRP